MDKNELLERIRLVKRWYQRIELMPGVITPGVSYVREIFAKLELPNDLTGLRILDIGTNDGFYAFECERRNAKEVVAIDSFPIEMTGFQVLKDFYGSSIIYLQDNLYNITPEKYGTFDIVLCLGVLYHLRTPLRGIERIRSVCAGILYLESFVIDGMIKQESLKCHASLISLPVMLFFPGAELNNDPSNWWGPTLKCLVAMLESTNFSIIKSTYNGIERAIIECEINDDARVRFQRHVEEDLYPLVT